MWTDPPPPPPPGYETPPLDAPPYRRLSSSGSFRRSPSFYEDSLFSATTTAEVAVAETRPPLHPRTAARRVADAAGHRFDVHESKDTAYSHLFDFHRDHPPTGRPPPYGGSWGPAAAPPNIGQHRTTAGSLAGGGGGGGWSSAATRGVEPSTLRYQQHQSPPRGGYAPLYHQYHDASSPAAPQSRHSSHGGTPRQPELGGDGIPTTGPPPRAPRTHLPSQRWSRCPFPSQTLLESDAPIPTQFSDTGVGRVKTPIGGGSSGSGGGGLGGSGPPARGTSSSTAQPPEVPNSMDGFLVTKLRVCDTRSAGPWLWVAFRGVPWLIPPPFVFRNPPPTIPMSQKAGLVEPPPESPSTHAQRHMSLFTPPGTTRGVRLFLIHYKCQECHTTSGEFRTDSPISPMPGPTLLALMRATEGEPFATAVEALGRRPPDVRISGLGADLIPWQSVAHVLHVATNVDIAMVDLFQGSQLGRGCVWLRDPGDVGVFLRRLYGRLWMAPVHHAYAVLATDGASQRWLHGYLAWLRGAGVARVPFARHFLTAERWRINRMRPQQPPPPLSRGGPTQHQHQHPHHQQLQQHPRHQTAVPYGRASSPSLVKPARDPPDYHQFHSW